MNQPSLTDKVKASKAKIGLVGVLGLILGFVLLGPKKEEAAPGTDSANSQVASAANGSPQNTHPVDRKVYDDFPTCCPADWLKYNPFAFDGKVADPPQSNGDRERPAVSDTGSTESPGIPAETLLPVGIILESSQGRAALYGQEIVREGQRTADGQIIERIEKGGVTVGIRRSEAESTPAGTSPDAPDSQN